MNLRTVLEPETGSLLNPDGQRAISQKTLIRDLDALVKMNLVRREGKAYYAANRELILAFLPRRLGVEST